MKKETILDCFMKENTKSVSIKNLSQKYKNYFTDAKQLPENFKQSNSQLASNFSRQSSEMSESISFYTALSRLTIEQSLLDDILGNQKNHEPFLTVENDKDENYKWYYKNSNGEMFGPLKSVEMDSRYKLGKFNKKTKIKTRGDDSYYPLINLLKRYSKIFKTKNLNIQDEPKKLSNKIKKFKKGEKSRTRNLMMGPDFNGEFVPVGKEDRTRTYAPRPNFDLNSLLDNDKNQKNDEQPNTRERAKTQV